MKKSLKTLASFIAVGFFVAIGIASGSDSNTDTQQQTTVDSTGQTVVVNWTYSEDVDAMTNAKEFYATCNSTNKIEFEFPYNGGSYGIIKLVNRKGKSEVIFRISKGQIISSFGSTNNCRVKFDDEAPSKFSYSSSSDGSSDILWFDKTTNFIQKLKKAKKVMIEVPFYQAGNQMFEFDVEGLVWDHK